MSDHDVRITEQPAGSWHWSCSDCEWVGLELHSRDAALREHERQAARAGTTNRDLSPSGDEMDRADPDDLRGAEMSGQTPSRGITASLDLDAIEHTLSVYTDTPDDRRILDATSDSRVPNSWTGMTFGNLRAVVAALAAETARADAAEEMACRTAADALTVDTERMEAEGQIAAVRALHRECRDHPKISGCYGCDAVWPCPTIRALDSTPERT